MEAKALYFNDHETAAVIMNATDLVHQKPHFECSRDVSPTRRFHQVGANLKLHSQSSLSTSLGSLKMYYGMLNKGCLLLHKRIFYLSYNMIKISFHFIQKIKTNN